jgi:hypothetical protein
MKAWTEQHVTLKDRENSRELPFCHAACIPDMHFRVWDSRPLYAISALEVPESLIRNGSGYA